MGAGGASAEFVFGPPDENLPEARDEDADRLDRLLRSDWHPDVGRGIRELDDDIGKQVPRLSGNRIGSLEASQYLAACIAATEAQLKERHRRYSPLRWLWYLRRAPNDLFAGDHPTTLAYDRGLAEALTWFADGAETVAIQEDPALRFPIDDAVRRHLLRLVAGVKFLAQLHVLARYAGKQASFRVPSAGSLLDVVPEPDMRDAIAVYDGRLGDETAHIFAGLGLTAATNMPAMPASDFPVLLLAPCEPRRVQCNVPDGGTLRPANVVCRTSFYRPLSAAHFLQPFGGPLEGESYPTGSALANLMLHMACARFLTHAPRSVSSLLRQGYLLVHEQVAMEVLANTLPTLREEIARMGFERNVPCSAAEWLAALEAVPPSLWPFVRGGFVRRQGTLLALDMTVASQALLDAFRARRLSGDKARGRQFELNLQAAIDETPWRPPPSIRKLRGVFLRIDGNDVTDVDAIAARGRTLVLVSCKSIVYGAAYDAGMFKEINNARSTVVDGVAEWKKRVARLAGTRLGDNYDFTEYGDLVGVVCTPFAPYVQDEAALAFVRPGLRANSSASELVRWLHEASAG